jgi:hypothetical protein
MVKFTAHVSTVEITSATPHIMFLPTWQGVWECLRGTFCGICTVRPRLVDLFLAGIRILWPQMRRPVAQNKVEAQNRAEAQNWAATCMPCCVATVTLVFHSMSTIFSQFSNFSSLLWTGPRGKNKKTKQIGGTWVAGIWKTITIHKFIPNKLVVRNKVLELVCWEHFNVSLYYKFI